MRLKTNKNTADPACPKCLSVCRLSERGSDVDWGICKACGCVFDIVIRHYARFWTYDRKKAGKP